MGSCRGEASKFEGGMEVSRRDTENGLGECDKMV
jgi:hypothetical protein